MSYNFFKWLGLALLFIPQNQLLAKANEKEVFEEPDIKVLIGSGMKEVSVSGVDLSKRIGTSASAKNYKGRKSLFFNCSPLQKYKNLKKPLLLAIINSATGLVGVQDGKYRGSVQMVAPPGGKGCDVVNVLPLETYIGAVLSKEMSPTWPFEALKAQAVAARSYAYHKIRNGRQARKGSFHHYDLENSERHQVNGDFFDVTARTSAAQRLTKGEVLAVGDDLVPVFFHSKCGGRTRLPEQVWSNAVPGYESVDCPFCHKRGVKDWTSRLPKEKFYSAVDRALAFYKGQKLNRPVSSFKVAPANSADSRFRVYDDEKLIELKKSRLRSVLGRKYAKSNLFSLKESPEEIVLEGKGFGHGVGLCQFGALEMAKRGYNYREILAHYFPKFKLKKLY